MKFEELMDGLRSTLRMPSLEPGRAGVYAIVFDAGLDVELLSLTDRIVLLRSSVADVPEEEDAREDFYRKHLQYNLLVLRDQTATLALDKDAGKVWLYRTVDSSQIDVRMFCDLVEDFVNTLEWWRSFESESQSQTVRPSDMLPFNMLRP